MAKTTSKVAEVTPSGEVKAIVLDAKQDIEERMNRLVKGAFISSDDLATEMAVISKNYSRETAAAQIDNILKTDLVRLKKIEGKVTMNIVRDVGLLRNNYILKAGNDKSGERDFRKWALDNHIADSPSVLSQYTKVFDACFNASGKLLPEFVGISTYNKAYLLCERSSEEIEKWKNLPDAKIKEEIKKVKKAAEAAKKAAEAADKATEADKAAEAADKAAEAADKAAEAAKKAAEAADKATEADKAAEAADKAAEAAENSETAESFDIPMMTEIDSVFEVLSKAAEADRNAALYIMRRSIDMVKAIGAKYNKV